MYGVLYALSPEVFPTKDRGTGDRAYNVRRPVCPISRSIAHTVLSVISCTASCMPYLQKYSPQKTEGQATHSLPVLTVFSALWQIVSIIYSNERRLTLVVTRLPLSPSTPTSLLRSQFILQASFSWWLVSWPSSSHSSRRERHQYNRYRL